MLLVSMAKSYVLHGLLLGMNSKHEGMTYKEERKSEQGNVIRNLSRKLITRAREIVELYFITMCCCFCRCYPCMGVIMVLCILCFVVMKGMKKNRIFSLFKKSQIGKRFITLP